MTCLKSLLFFGFIYCVHADTLSVPIIRGKSALKRLAEQNVPPQIVEQMILKEFNSSIGKGNGTDPVPLRKYLDWEYFAEVQIGQPGHVFKAILDTTWGVSWITDVGCPITSIGCLSKSKYDPKQSATSNNTRKPFNINLSNSNLSGIIFKDKLTINQASINYTFASCDRLPWFFYFSDADGVLGMGYTDLAQNFPGHPLVYEMVNQNAIKQPVFSIYFNKEPSTERGGTLFIGGVETRHFRGNLTYVEAPRKEYLGYWAFKMDKISVKNSKDKSTFCNGGCTAIMDSGENIIQGPLDEVEELNKAIGAQRFYFNRYMFNCNKIHTIPKVHFTIGNKDYVLKGSNLVQKIFWGPAMMCLSVFKSSESKDNVWFLGGPFMSSYYTTYDIAKERIGFAESFFPGDDC